MPLVKIVPQNISVKCDVGETLASAIKKVVPGFPTPCGGRGFCGKCVVRVIDGRLTEETGNEKLHGLPPGYRLACQARILGDVTVEIRKIGRLRALASGIEPKIEEINPLVRPLDVTLKRPTIAEPIPYDRQIMEQCGASVAGLHVYRRLEKGVPDRLVAFTRGRTVVKVAEYCEKVGLAVDVGTTKIAAYLVNLENGRTMAEDFSLNPQSKYGDDVISRITHAARSRKALEDMQSSTISVIEALAEKLCSAMCLKTENIAALCVVGNTVMTNILLGLDPTPIGRAPFTPHCSTPVECYASEVGFRAFPDAWLYIPPGVTGFVGADAVSDILVAETLGYETPALLLDIGTNTEVALFLEGETYVASAPAGPALEGGNISCGTKSLEGAIYKVKLSDGRFRYWSYGEPPSGLCGSGVLSVTAELLRAGVVDSSGRLKVGVEGDRSVKIAENVFFTQKDVREVQKAKAAISSAWRTLMTIASVNPDELNRVFICGSFGSNIDPEDALDLGLIPPVERSKIALLGNSAGAGARLILKSEQCRRKAEEIASTVKFFELASHPSFRKIWIKSLQLGA